MWATREADIACRLAIARSPEVAAKVVGRSVQDIEELLKSRGQESRPWCEMEIDLLHFYIVRYDVVRCGKFLNRTPEEIMAKIEEQNKRYVQNRDIGKRRWTAKEAKRAETLIKEGLPHSEVANICHRTEDAISFFASSRGLGHKPRRWTEEEVEIVKKWARRKSWVEIGRMVNRSRHAVYKYAKTSGILG